MHKPILCLDFDGVIHSYTSKWIDEMTIPDPPVPGALRWIWEATKHFTVVIYSSRSKSEDGRRAMREWMGKWSVDDKFGIPHDWDNAPLAGIGYAAEKPAAFLTIDDRALTFTGVWPDIEDLLAFQPWNKKKVDVAQNP
jgi:hypothetical protein